MHCLLWNSRALLLVAGFVYCLPHRAVGERPTMRFRKALPTAPIQDSLSIATVPLLVSAVEPIGNTLTGWKQRDRAQLRKTLDNLELVVYETQEDPDAIEEHAIACFQIALLSQFPSGIPNRRGDAFDRDALYEQQLTAINALNAQNELSPTAETLHYLACSHFLAGRALLRGPEPPTNMEVGIGEYEEALTVWAALAEEYTEDTRYPRFCMDQARLIAAWKKREGDLVGAAAVLESIDPLADRHAGQLPPAERTTFLIAHHTTLAALHAKSEERLAAARRLAKVVDLRIAAWDPTQKDVNRGLRILRSVTQLAAQRAGEFDTKALRKKCQPIIDQLSTQRSIQSAWAEALTQFAVNSEDSGDIPRAIALYKEAVKVKQRLNRMDETEETFRVPYELTVPEAPLTTVVIMRDLSAIAQLQSAHRDYAAALATYRYAIKLWEELASSDSQLKKSLPSHPEALAALPMQPRMAMAATLKSTTGTFRALPPSAEAFRKAAAEVYRNYAALILSVSKHQADEAVAAAETACMLTHYENRSLLDLLATAYEVVGRDDAPVWKQLTKTR